MASTIAEVLSFWFNDETKSHWFASTPAFDERVKAALGQTYELAGNGNFIHWEQTREGRLALLILLDQVPRMIFRGTPESYSSDDAALALAKRCLLHGDDIALPKNDERRSFLYLPFMHSENLDDQRRSVELHETFGPEAGLSWARGHRDVIARFGRFPHRNARLGRQSSASELDFLKAKDGAR